MGGANAQILFSNAITGTNPNTANPFTSGQVVASDLTVSGIGRGSGILGTNANDRYNANNWGAGLTESQALSESKYFTFTLEAADDFEIDFTSFTFVAQGSATGAHSFAVFSSVGGFSLGNELLTFTQPGTSAYTTATQTVNLAGASFQNLTGPVEFRIYAWNAGNGTSGTFSVNEFAFNGSVAAVPEPSTYAMLIAGAGLMVWVIRRKRKVA